MKTPSEHIFLRGDIYYYRRRIHPRLNNRKSHSLIFSLHTKSYLDAKRLAGWYDAYFDNVLLHQLLKGREMSKKMPIDMVFISPTDDKAVEITPEDLKVMSPEQLIAFVTAFMSSPYPVNFPSTSAAVEVKSVVESTKDQDYPLLSEAIEQYYAHKTLLKKNFKPSSKQRTIFRRLIEMLGDIRIDKIKAQDANAVLRMIQELPASDSAKFRNKTVTEILRKKPFESTFSTKNINDYLIEYRALFNEMNRLYQIPNAFNGLIVKEINKQPKEKLSFDRNDLKLIFSQPLFKSGEYKNQYQFWTPLIALFSGARRGEISQLRTYDIEQEDGIWFFNFNENIQKGDDGNKKIKNTASFRKTPIHSFLIELGILHFKNSLDRGRLFPDSGAWTDKEGYGRYIGEKFNAFSKQAGVAHEKTFKSFRSTFLSELERMGVTDRDLVLLAGHVDEFPNVREKHYFDDKKLPYLFEQIKKLDFSDVLIGVKPKQE